MVGRNIVSYFEHAQFGRQPLIYFYAVWEIERLILEEKIYNENRVLYPRSWVDKINFCRFMNTFIRIKQRKKTHTHKKNSIKIKIYCGCFNRLHFKYWIDNSHVSDKKIMPPYLEQPTWFFLLKFKLSQQPQVQIFAICEIYNVTLTVNYILHYAATWSSRWDYNVSQLEIKKYLPEIRSIDWLSKA